MSLLIIQNLHLLFIILMVAEYINNYNDMINLYESPKIDILQVLVEKGFVGSGSSSNGIEGGLGGSEGMDGGGDINVGW